MKSYRELIDETIELKRSKGLGSNEAARIICEIYKYDNYKAIAKNLGRYESKDRLKSDHAGLAKHCDERGIEISDVKLYWDKTKEYSVAVKMDQSVKTYEDLRDEIIDQMQKYSPIYPEIERKNIEDGHLLVVDPADIHIGKLSTDYETGDEYNSNIAFKRVLEGVRGIIQKSQGFNIDRILFIAGNDILHIDSPKRTTTSGTPQDTDGMFYENFLCAKKLYVEVIEILLQVANVHFVFNPSNHDYQSGFYLADVIQSWFRNSKNITFDCSISHRKYFQYGKNLIGSTHGDGAKPSDLPLLMAVEAKEMWARTQHKYVYSHHLHHKVSKDFIGVTVESLRSPSGADSWHHRNGFQHATKAIEGFIHHKDHGQVARLSHIF
jgi:hypothetical protein